MNDVEEKIPATELLHPPGGSGGPPTTTDCPTGPQRSPASTDWLVVVATKDPALLGKRFVLEHAPLRVGRDAENEIRLDDDLVAGRHGQFERRGADWLVVDLGAAGATCCNDKPISGEVVLKNRDRVKIGQTIFKFLSGADIEAQYHEEIYRMTILDGLTQIHNKRYLYEALDREIVRSRRHERELSILRFDIDHFKRVNDLHGPLAGDHVLKELARIVQARIRRDEVFARPGGDELAIILPETSLVAAVALAEKLRRAVATHLFVLQAATLQVTISLGAAVLEERDRGATDLLQRAGEQLGHAKSAGRNRVAPSLDAGSSDAI